MNRNDNENCNDNDDDGNHYGININKIFAVKTFLLYIQYSFSLNIICVFIAVVETKALIGVWANRDNGDFVWLTEDSETIDSLYIHKYWKMIVCAFNRITTSSAGVITYKLEGAWWRRRIELINFGKEEEVGDGERRRLIKMNRDWQSLTKQNQEEVNVEDGPRKRSIFKNDL